MSWLGGPLLPVHLHAWAYILKRVRTRRRNALGGEGLGSTQLNLIQGGADRHFAEGLNLNCEFCTLPHLAFDFDVTPHRIDYLFADA